MSDNPTASPSPDEEPTAEELAAASAIRPLEELPSPWTIKGNPRMTSEVSLSALSPADQQAVREAAGTNDPDAIQAALHGFLRQRSVEFRLKAGAGDGATEPEREALSQMNQLRLLGDEFARIETELAEVRSHRTEHDADGNPVAVPVYALNGALRTSRENRLNEIKHAMSLLAGIEGEAAMQGAVRAQALRTRTLNSQIADQREITRRAHEVARERRINAAAETKAKFLNGLGD